MHEGPRHRTNYECDNLFLYKRKGEETLSGLPTPTNGNLLCIKIKREYWVGSYGAGTDSLPM